MTKKLNFIITILVTGTLVFSFCSSSSPESDGIKAAKKFCDCIDEGNANTIKAYESYIKNFNSFSFKTRIEAREKLNEFLQKAQEETNRCQENAYAYRNELESKYITNEENKNKFWFAFDAHGNAFRPKEQFSKYAGTDINSLNIINHSSKT